MPVPTTAQGRIRWPQPSALAGSLAGDELDELLAEQEKLQDQLAQVQREQRHLHNAGRLAAEAADREAYARALRAGDPDPGPTAVTKLQADVVAAERRRAALEQAIQNVTADAQARLEQRHDAYAEDAARLEVEAHAALTLVVAELGEAVRDYTDRRQLAEWLDGSRGGAAPVVEGLAKASGEPYSAVELLERLTAAVATWKR